ncbi:MAG TPA: hypothetical protein VI565_04495, partial [Burkholderiales bacterium]|nr:hypothetical protein [Burkholderiales bacterium]
MLRIATAATLSLTLAALLSEASLIRIVPNLPATALLGIPYVGGVLAALFAVSPLTFWGTLAALLAFAQCAYTSFSKDARLSEHLGLCLVVLVLNGYAWSNLDWTRLAIDLHLSHGGVPPATAILFGAAPLGVAILFKLLLQPMAARDHYRKKGVDATEAEGALGLSGLGMTVVAIA